MLDLLDQPAVAVRIAERHEGPVVGALRIDSGRLPLRTEMERLADVNATLNQLHTRCLDIGHDKMEALVGSRRDLRDARADVIEQAEPGGVSCTTRKASPA